MPAQILPVIDDASHIIMSERLQNQMQYHEQLMGLHQQNLQREAWQNQQADSLRQQRDQLEQQMAPLHQQVMSQQLAGEQQSQQIAAQGLKDHIEDREQARQKNAMEMKLLQAKLDNNGYSTVEEATDARERLHNTQLDSQLKEGALSEQHNKLIQEQQAFDVSVLSQPPEIRYAMVKGQIMSGMLDPDHAADLLKSPMTPKDISAEMQASLSPLDKNSYDQATKTVSELAKIPAIQQDDNQKTEFVQAQKIISNVVGTYLEKKDAWKNAPTIDPHNPPKSMSPWGIYNVPEIGDNGKPVYLVGADGKKLPKLDGDGQQMKLKDGSPAYRTRLIPAQWDPMKNVFVTGGDINYRKLLTDSNGAGNGNN